ncbi:hypothetical protein R1sor_002288 [Riccia sorocarpa]|uniref:Protein kinase domain-containing protein n=1 Tax=Riccia sorocarpa TaxID=122646 RepID=A0ABD3H2J0_9MARC
MATTYAGNGLASLLVPRVVRDSGPSTTKPRAALRGASKFSGSSKAQIAGRAENASHGKLLQMRFCGDIDGRLKPVRVTNPLLLLCSNATIPQAAGIHPYERSGRKRRAKHKLTVSCNARSPVDALEDTAKVVVNLVDKEIVLRPVEERAEMFQKSSELKESPRDSAEDAALSLEEEESKSTNVPLSKVDEITNIDKEANGLQNGHVVSDAGFDHDHSFEEDRNVAQDDLMEVEYSRPSSTGLVDREILHGETLGRGNFDALETGCVPKPQTKRTAGAFGGIKKILAKDREVLMGWARDLSERTGVDKILKKDVGIVEGAVTWLKELAIPSLKKEVTEIVAMRILEDPSVVPTPSPEWPKPEYGELSGRALLEADVLTLGSYGDYFKEVVGAWRVPLQLSYNPDYVADYFNRRPHLIVFRLLEVAAAFGFIAFQIFIDGQRMTRNSAGVKDEEEQLQYTRKSATALKETLIGLGPTFIKVAQSLSARPDVIGTDTAKVLSELQDRLAPFPTEEARAVIEQELGAPVNQLFSYLSEEPVAAASFGQVYRGRTTEGEEVAVKVQRPGLLFTVARDVYILRLGLGLVRKLAKMNSDISVLADELGRGLFGELDYTQEAANARLFESAHAQLPYVKVPKTLPHLTTRRTLTMEWIDGFRPSDLQSAAQGGTLSGEVPTALQPREAKIALDSLVKKGVECSLVQILETGVMHADPHPGNFLYTKDGYLAYLDFGLICSIEKRHRAAMLASIAHLVNGEWAGLANDLGDMDVLKPTTDRFALRLALERSFVDDPDVVVGNGNANINFRQATGKLFQIALKFRLRLPPYYTLVLRSLVSLEGMALVVDPNYKVYASAYPYVVKRLLTDNSRPAREVLLSLVLNDKKQLRWDRLASIVKTSRGEAPRVEGTEVVGISGVTPVTAVEEDRRKKMSMRLLSFALSRKGTSLRRVLVEADTKSLVETFISASASTYRREVANVLSEGFYQSGLNLLKIEHECSTSADSSLVSGEDGTERKRGHTASGQELNEMLLGSSDISRYTMLKNRRLWFLMKVLAGKLRGFPILRLKVAWTVTNMICYAAAIALHGIMITLSDRLLVRDSSPGFDVPPAAPLVTSDQVPGPVPVLV